MGEEIKPVEVKKTGTRKTRPVILTVVCLFFMVFFTLLSALFASALAGAEWITKVTNQYVQFDTWSIGEIRWLFAAGFALHLAGLAGCVLIWFMKKAGYYLLGSSSLLITAIQLFRPEFTVTFTALYIFIIIFFGLFFKRLH